MNITYNTFDFDFCRMIDDLIDYHKNRNKKDVSFYLGTIPEEIIYGKKNIFITVDSNIKDKRNSIYFIFDNGPLIGYLMIPYSSVNVENHKRFEAIIYRMILTVIKGTYKNNFILHDQVKFTCNGLELKFISNKDGEVSLDIFIDDNMKEYIKKKMGD